MVQGDEGKDWEEGDPLDQWNSSSFVPPYCRFRAIKYGGTKLEVLRILRQMSPNLVSDAPFRIRQISEGNPLRRALFYIFFVPAARQKRINLPLVNRYALEI